MRTNSRLITTITKPTEVLKFKPLESKDIEIIRPYLNTSGSRSCDLTIGGLYIWKDLFKYKYCIYKDTLYIQSMSEDGSNKIAFLMPIGQLPLSESVIILRDYCTANNIPLIFTAVPDDCLDSFINCFPTQIIELSEWADYVYDAESLSTLVGKQYNKKRNHVNRFIKDNPNFKIEKIDDNNVREVEEFFATLGIESMKADEEMAYFEWERCGETLKHYKEYGLEGALLRGNDGKIVAFTLGETSRDTLVIHIEKMEHLIPGAGETINKLFAATMCREHPQLKYINREDDAGDPGLRYAKESYHPVIMLKKYNVEFYA